MRSIVCCCELWTAYELRMSEWSSDVCSSDLPGADLGAQMNRARSEAKSAFGNDERYVEKLLRRARHVEVQVLGDTHGNLIHLFVRDCSVQRRNQKVVERDLAPYLSEDQRQELCGAAMLLCKQVN